ncbi:MAG: hypothetical protein HY237_05295 [Acidobacteria bacterium]|nr:hypothetical protein [Acidobacteriota bacterium]
MEQKTSAARRDFYVRVPARLLKDPKLSPEAKLLRVILAAYADARTGRTFVGLATLERLLRCGRAGSSCCASRKHPRLLKMTAAVESSNLSVTKVK